MLSQYLTLAATLSTAYGAVLQGFNYASLNVDGSYRVQSDFETEFKTAQNLVGTSGFNSARIYTMIQANTPNTPISAIPAAIKTNTTLLLGIWCSAGQEVFNNELAALNNAIEQYGSEFTDLVVGMSVGSEDLYRDSEMGQKSNAGIGVGPDVVANYIGQVRTALSKTALKNTPIGHVDTWTAWVNGTNAPVVEAVDWIGFDAYPYFQNTMSNNISESQALFYEALDNTKAAVGGKPVWITETGWPVSGKTENLGVPSVENAEMYWKMVGCKILGVVNTYWYTLNDYHTSMTVPSFGVVSSDSNNQPLYDLSCSAEDKVLTSSSSSPSSSTQTSTRASTAGSSTSTPTTGSGGNSGDDEESSSSSGSSEPQATPTPSSGPGTGGAGAGGQGGSSSASVSATTGLVSPPQATSGAAANYFGAGGRWSVVLGVIAVVVAGLL